MIPNSFTLDIVEARSCSLLSYLPLSHRPFSVSSRVERSYQVLVPRLSFQTQRRRQEARSFVLTFLHNTPVPVRRYPPLYTSSMELEVH